jgi:hypothetical protein
MSLKYFVIFLPILQVVLMYLASCCPYQLILLTLKSSIQALRYRQTRRFFQWLYSPCWAPSLFFSSVISFYTHGRTHWKSDKSVARPLPTHRTTQTQKKRIHRHPCLEWDSNPRSQLSSERRQRQTRALLYIVQTRNNS